MFVLGVGVEVVEEVVFGSSLEVVMRAFIIGEAWTTVFNISLASHSPGKGRPLLAEVVASEMVQALLYHSSTV